jgi:hypothetical protein
MMKVVCHRLADAMIALVEQRVDASGQRPSENRAERDAVDPGEVRSVLVNARNDLSQEFLRAGLDSGPYRDDPVSGVLRDGEVAKAIAVYLGKEGMRPVDRRESLLEWKEGYAVFGLGCLGGVAGGVLGFTLNPYLGMAAAVLGCLGLVIGVSLMGIGQEDYRPSRALREQRRGDCRTLIANKLMQGATKTKRAM